jgi:hypothetical protein
MDHRGVHVETGEMMVGMGTLYKKYFFAKRTQITPQGGDRMASKRAETGIVVQFGCHGATRWHCVGIPVTALLFQYIVWRTALKALWNHGINWRGTHYSLQELKANKV